MVPGRTGIEHLKPHLHVLAFGNGEDFGEAQVEILVERPAQFALSLVAICPLWDERKNVGIEPFRVAPSEAAVRIACLVRAISAGERHAHLVKATDGTPIHSESPAGGDGVNSARLPAAENPIGRSQ